MPNPLGRHQDKDTHIEESVFKENAEEVEGEAEAPKAAN
jgi:hypothetical protein